MKALLSRVPKPLKLLLPCMLTLYTLIGLGVLSALLETVKHIDDSMKIFSSSDFYKSLGLSVRLAFGSTAFSCLLGLIIIYGLFLLSIKNKTPLVPVLSRAFQAPMLVPYIVAGYLVFLTFGQSGLISRILYHIGLIEGISDFPVLTNDPAGLGILIAFVWKTTPFIILMLYPAMLSLDMKYLEMSQMFGIGPRKYFFHVLIPHMMSTIVFSSFIVFAYTLTSFEIPYMLGATYPKTLSVSAYQLYTGGSLNERYEALTMSLILFIISILLGYFAFRKSTSHQKHLKGGSS